MNFNDLIEQCHKERKFKEWCNRTSLISKCDYEYALFSIWCRMNEKQPTEENFKDYIKAENKSFDFWQNKYIYETYFNYEFCYDYETKKWHCNKK